MTDTRLIPAKFRVFSGSVLKTAALVLMLVDHIAAHFLYGSSISVLKMFGFTLTLYNLMRSLGRMAFPIFAFLLVEGFVHTKSRKRYGISLAVFAVVSEIPWNLCHSGALLCESQNVFFTLLIGYIGICSTVYVKNIPLRALVIFAGLGVSAFCNFDFGMAGYCFILLMYALRKDEIIRAAAGLVVLPSKWLGALAFIPIAFYNGKRGFIKGRVLKYCCYAFYPVHLLVIYFVKYVIINDV